MIQKYLIPVDNMNSSIRIANYVKNIIKKSDKITLYTVLVNPTIIYNINDPAAIPLYTENKEVFSAFEETRKKEMKKIFERMKNIISKSGFSKNNIGVKFEIQKETTARHIADEAIKGKYDVIVMGKHNTSRLSEFFLGSVSHKVIHLSKNIPVILI